MREVAFHDAYPLALRAAGARSSLAVAAGHLLARDREDWVQEGLLAVWRALPRYDSSRASLRTFIERVVANRFASLMRSKRRHPQFESIEDHYHPTTLDGIPRLESRIDCERTVASLEVRRRLVAAALTEHTITDISRQVGLSRSTIYARISEIRTHFAEAGLGPNVPGGNNRK